MSDIISWLLVTGVSASAALVAVGLLLIVVTGSTGYEVSASPLPPPGAGTSYPRSAADILAGVLALKPAAVIELGLIVLIATPLFRVLASIPLFWMERDKLYVLITSAVLAVLVISILWIH